MRPVKIKKKISKLLKNIVIHPESVSSEDKDMTDINHKWTDPLNHFSIT